VEYPGIHVCVAQAVPRSDSGNASISLRICSAVISTFALAEINHLFWAIVMILQLSRKVWSIVKRLAILGNFLQANDGGKL
jgi:hypothetical protein